MYLVPQCNGLLVRTFNAQLLYNQQNSRIRYTKPKSNRLSPQATIIEFGNLLGIYLPTLARVAKFIGFSSRSDFDSTIFFKPSVYGLNWNLILVRQGRSASTISIGRNYSPKINFSTQMIQTNMRRWCNKAQILQSVIKFVVVLVMNVFMTIEYATQMLFHYKTMNIHVATSLNSRFQIAMPTVPSLHAPTIYQTDKGHK